MFGPAPRRRNLLGKKNRSEWLYNRFFRLLKVTSDIECHQRDTRFKMGQLGDGYNTHRKIILEII